MTKRYHFQIPNHAPVDVIELTKEDWERIARKAGRLKKTHGEFKEMLLRSAVRLHGRPLKRYYWNVMPDRTKLHIWAAYYHVNDDPNRDLTGFKPC